MSDTITNDRCPGCNLSWRLFPPAHIHGLPMIRCIECKRIYFEGIVKQPTMEGGS